MGRPKQIFDPRSTPKAKAIRLRRLRKLTTLERANVCEKYGINASTLKGWENARANGLSKKGAQKFLKIADDEGVICTLEWLMYGIGSSPRVLEKPEDAIGISQATSEPIIFQNQNEEEKLIIRELQLFREHHPQTLDFIVNDNGMEPYYQKGDYIAGIKYQGNQINKILESLCIVQTKDGRLLFRKLKTSTELNRYTLSCINPDATVREPILYHIELIAAAPVLWHRKQKIDIR